MHQVRIGSLGSLPSGSERINSFASPLPVEIGPRHSTILQVALAKRATSSTNQGDRLVSERR